MACCSNCAKGLTCGGGSKPPMVDFQHASFPFSVRERVPNFGLWEPEPRRVEIMVGGSDAQAKEIITQAWKNVWGKEPPPAARQIAQAIARFDGGYGNAGWGGACTNAHNWGAVQCCLPKKVDGKNVCPPGSCLHSDSFADGRRYAVCFRSYPNDLAGATDFIAVLTKQRPSVYAEMIKSTPKVWDVAWNMHTTHYFGGFGKTKEQQVRGYFDAIRTHQNKIASALGEKVYGDGSSPGHPSSAGGKWILFGGLALVLGGAAFYATTKEG